MSSEIAIKVGNLSKCFQIYQHPRDRLKQFFLPRIRNLIGLKNKQYYREFWALNNVSLDIKKGETIGIIGQNGSGKSTLLQIICGTLNPSSGTVTTNGRIAALLELGSGFNPEFTGRENVYLNATVLGLSAKEIDARFDAIAAFADIGEFIEQPIKMYSSGMMVRLAFAVAINVDPEILIIDEALSVGDELFQRKCFSRIEAIRNAGTTILFVSHSGGTVVELCDRAVLLDYGEKIAVGTPKKIVALYQKLLYAPKDKRENIREKIIYDSENSLILELGTSDTDHLSGLGLSLDLSAASDSSTELTESFDPSLMPVSTIRYESHGANIENPGVYTLAGDQVNNLIRGKIYRYRYQAKFDSPATNVRFGMLLKTTTGLELGGAASAASSRTSIPFVVSGSLFTVEFEFVCRLNPGVYFLNAGVNGEINGVETYLHRLIDVAMFRVIPEENNVTTGIVDFSCVPKIYLQV